MISEKTGFTIKVHAVSNYLLTLHNPRQLFYKSPILIKPHLPLIDINIYQLYINFQFNTTVRNLSKLLYNFSCL